MKSISQLRDIIGESLRDCSVITDNYPSIIQLVMVGDHCYVQLMVRYAVISKDLKVSEFRFREGQLPSKLTLELYSTKITNERFLKALEELLTLNLYRPCLLVMTTSASKFHKIINYQEVSTVSETMTWFRMVI